MRRGSGLSFIEIVFASALLLILLVPLGLMLAQAERGTRSSVDEFYATLYLTELVSQVAAMPFAALPVMSAPRDLPTTDPVALDPEQPETVVRLAPLRANFTVRTVQISDVDGPPAGLRKVRATVTYTGDGRQRTLDMVTLVGSGSRVWAVAP